VLGKDTKLNPINYPLNPPLTKESEYGKEIGVTFSPDSSPEHGIDYLSATSGHGIGSRDASIIGLNEGTFHNVMKLIEESDEEDYVRNDMEKAHSEPTLSVMYNKKENLSSSVEKSQVDGGFDSLSSVSYSPEPSRF
jgi:hypothetical protein